MKYYPTSTAFEIQTFRPNQTKTFDLPRLKRGRIEVKIHQIIDRNVPRPDPRNPVPGISIDYETGISAKVMNGSVLIMEGTDHFSKVNNIEGGGFKISVKNNHRLKSKIVISVNYVSDRLILEKKIPISFFQQTFDNFWNKVQPIKTVQLNNNTLDIIWNDELRKALELPTVHYEFGTIPIAHTELTIRDLKSTEIRFSASSKVYGSERLPLFTVQIFFEDEGVNELELKGIPNVDLKEFSIKVEFLLVQSNQKLGIDLIPKVYGQVDARGLPDGLIDDKFDSKVEAVIKQEIGKHLPKYASKISKWFLGGEFIIYSLKVQDDIIVIEYVGNPSNNNTNNPNIGSIGHGSTNPIASASHFPTQSFGPVTNIRTVGKLKEIDHIVVLMMENRSFDQMLGYLSLETRSDKTLPNYNINGLKAAEYDNWANEYNGEKFKPYKLKEDEVHIKTSPNHSYLSVKDQKAYNMKGFVTDFANIEGLEDDPKVIMGYYDDKQLKVYAQLANEFLVCDHWYCAFPGGTWPNRFITLSGKLATKPDGSADYNNPSLSEFYPLRDKTLFDILTEKNVSWRYFEHGYCFLRLYEKYTYDLENIVDANNEQQGFFELARTGRLPSVSFIDPDFIEYPPGNDDHAPAHPHCGQKLIGKIVNALMSNEDAWKKTMLIITYDEHGGFFDHVNPETDEPAPAVSGTSKEYGIRVPTIIVSPWVEKGGYTNKLLDHTSIAATIFRRFCSPRIPDMGVRTNNASDLEHVMEDNVRENIPSINIPEYPECEVFGLRAPRSAPIIDGIKGEDDFHELLLMASMFGRAPK